MATGIIQKGIISTRLLQQNGATFGTTYSFDSSKYKMVLVWVNQAGWRDSLILPLPLLTGAYGLSTGGQNNTIRIDLTATTLVATKLNTSIGNTFDLQIYGIA